MDQRDAAAGMNDNIPVEKFRPVILCPLKGVIGRNFFFGKNSQAIFGNAVEDVAQIYIL
ncbi:MAG TPA: hypothetical protein VJW95_07000 [Dissulfurispiraceae bacterium]|nr:hypothetical protein [Dissulfurispiraceae bacterium]